MPTNNIDCYRYADKTEILVYCKYKKIKNENKEYIRKETKRKMIVSTSSKVSFGNCFSRLIWR